MCVCVCVCACVRACARARVCAHVCVFIIIMSLLEIVHELFICESALQVHLDLRTGNYCIIKPKPKDPQLAQIPDEGRVGLYAIEICESIFFSARAILSMATQMLKRCRKWVMRIRKTDEK